MKKIIFIILCVAGMATAGTQDKMQASLGMIIDCTIMI